LTLDVIDMREKIFILCLIFLAGFCGCKKEALSEDVLRQEMLKEVNSIRRSGCQCGNDWMPAVQELTWNQQLESAAQFHAKDMHDRNYFDHISPEGTSPIQRAQTAGYSGLYVGENIGRGYTTVQEVVAAWKKSEAHCRAMMDSLYKEMGVALYEEYWVQELGKPN
jgi:uncharacterized protein YkwD